MSENKTACSSRDNLLGVARVSVCFAVIVTFTLAASHGRLALAQSDGVRAATNGKAIQGPVQENHSEAIAEAERALADAGTAVPSLPGIYVEYTQERPVQRARCLRAGGSPWVARYCVAAATWNRT